MSEHITLKSIADQLGVTHGTVSRALQGDRRVRASTAERIRELAQQLGYTPSRLGRGLRSQHSGTVGILVASIADPFYAAVIEGAGQLLQQRGYGMLLSDSTEGQDEAVRLLQEHRVDGFLVHVPAVTVTLQRLLDKPASAVVLINGRYGGWPLTVSSDDHRGARECVEHLVSSGHRRIGYLSGGGRVDGVRQAAYLDVLHAAGLQPEVRQAGEASMQAGRRAMRDWMDELPDAIFCYNDVLAVGAMRACHEARMELPRELALVGFDDIELAGFVSPSLTTYAQPRRELGWRAAEMLLSRLSDPTGVQTPVTLQGELRIRESSRSER